jgi:DNA (cytosine-5)-methyltransferase 1
MFRGREGNPTLLGQVQLWATPQARDWRAETGEFRPDHFPTLGRQVRQIETAGDPPSLSTPRLNPRFVEWLMGFPIGWTDFAASATEWSRWRQLMRSELSRLGWESPC